MLRKSRRIFRQLELSSYPDATIHKMQRPATISDLIRRWIPSMLPMYKPSTRQFVTTTIGLLEDCFGNLRLNELSTELLQAYIAGVRRSPKTIANRITVFRSLWKSAVQWGYARHDPFIGLHLPRVVEPETRCFTFEEVMLILEAATEPYRTLYRLAAETGLRGGEICALPWSEVDLQAQTIRVVQSIWRGELSTPKTKAGRRRICISPGLSEAMSKLETPRNGTVFANHSGKPFNPEKVVQRHLKPLLNQLGIPTAGLHAFRHFNASMMDQECIPMKTRQVRLGHSSPQTTLQLYTHLLDEADKQAAATLATHLTPRASSCRSLKFWSASTLQFQLGTSADESGLVSAKDVLAAPGFVIKTW